MAARRLMLPAPWDAAYRTKQPAIRQRLLEFSAIPPEDYFYELAYCILTPQSMARHANLVIAELQRDAFLERGFDPTPYLRNPQHYIRFHLTKAKRLLAARETLPSVLPQLCNPGLTATEKRAVVLESLNGFGMKEASHFLRNIGVRNLAILDRHIFKHLVRLGVLPEIPKHAPTARRYLEIEANWQRFAAAVGIPMDELDLLFWSMETGEILK